MQYFLTKIPIFIGSLLFYLVMSSAAFAQVKIGDNPETINAASILELESSSKALVLTRVTDVQMLGIAPFAGALVYNLDKECIFQYNGSDWTSLCEGTAGITILDNGDGTYSFSSSDGSTITINGAPETVTNLEDNLDGTFTYTNEAGTETTIISGNSGGVSISDNGDGTFTVDDGINPPFDFNGAPDRISTLVDNGNSTYTYTNEAGTETNVISGGSGGVSITNNGDGTFTVADGTNPPFDFNGAPETLSTLVDNGNSTYTYFNEAGTETTIVSGSSSGGLSITDNGDGTFTVDDGVNPPFVFNGAPESTTTIVDNLDGTYIYTNEIGSESTIVANSGGHTGAAGSVFFAGADGEPTENNAQLYWDDNIQQLAVGNRLLIPDGSLSTNSTLSVRGSLSTDIDFIPTAFSLTDEHHTVLINGNTTIYLPPASETKGRMYILKKRPGDVVNLLPYGYLDNTNQATTSFPLSSNILWLQSNGYAWEQIN